MKNFYRYLLAAVVAVACSLAAKAATPPQEMRLFFEECSKYDKFETVIVDRELLQMADNVNFGLMGVKDILGKIETIGIVTTEDKKAVVALRGIADKHFNSSATHGNYNVLMSAKEDDEQTQILQSENKTLNKNTFVIINREPSEMTVVVIYGNLTTNDIKKLKL